MPGGFVRINAEMIRNRQKPELSHVRLSVEDSGVGMTRKQTDKLF